MRIDRLDLIAYGHFTGKSLDLSDGDCGLHLIYGDNEAGKSTSLRALIAWLFGIPARTRDNFIHSNPQLRIGGKLKLLDGKSLEFVRRKGRKGTLLTFDGDEVLDDSTLLPFLPGSIDETLFTKLYGIDYGRLVEGGQELLNQSGDLGQALFSAAVGTESLRDILSDLQKGADELFKPSASKPLINQALKRFKEAQKQIRDLSLPVAEWKKLQKALATTLSDLKQVEDEINDKGKEKNRLDRLNRVKGALAERRAVVTRIEEMKDVLVLPEQFDEKRKAASENFLSATVANEKAEAKLCRLKDESDALNVRMELLENEGAILSIHKALGAVEKTIIDRPQQDGKRRLLRNEAKIILKSVRPDITIEDADQLRPLLKNKKWISGLAQKHGLLTQKKESAKATLRDVEDEIASIKRALGDHSRSNLDLTELKAAIAVANKAGDLEERLSVSQKRTSDSKVACDNELARLGRFSGTTEALLKLSIPVPETLDMFEKKRDEIADEMKEYRRKERELNKEWNETEEHLKALLLKSDIPTIADLEAARTLRNTRWHLIKQKYVEKNNGHVRPPDTTEHESLGSTKHKDFQINDVEQEIKLYASDADLVALYEQNVNGADHLSDRLRLDADQVVKRADLEAKLNVLKSHVQSIAKAVGNANEAWETLQKEWTAIWKPLDIDPGTPKEMKQWVMKLEKLLANIDAANAAYSETNKLADACQSLKKTISLQISKFDPSIEVTKMSLEAMITLCEQRVENEESALQRTHQLEHSLDEAMRRLKRAEEELKSIENDQASWIDEWGQAIDGLGLKSDVHPEHATEAFDQLFAFFDKFDKSEELRRRIWGMDQVAKEFEEKVFDLLHRIGFERDEQPAIQIAAQLNRDLNEAREARASLKKIEIQANEIAEEIENTKITIRTAQEELLALKDQAGVKTDEALEIAAESAKKKRELMQKLETLEQELTRNGDGLNIEALEKEAAESDIDAIEVELEKVSSELQGLQTSRDTLRDQRQTWQNEIKAKDGRAMAANASEEVEQQLATIASGVEQYLRLQIAALILEQRIEAYRKKNQAPVLARAGELFSKLTLGSYANLRDELADGGKPILLGVRPNEEEVSIDGMSEGSRDQLYLSLRLATLEQHLSKGEPMPFVVDDILMGFDDHRTKVCLEVLAKLADRTQVLLFTHHSRVLELANTIKAKAGIYTHELS